MKYTKIAKIHNANFLDLLLMPNVVGVGVGYKVAGGEVTDELSIIANVSRKLPKDLLTDSQTIPLSFHGAATDVIETGVIAAPRTFPQSFTNYMRPAFGGCSIGHYSITAGTLGCLVYVDGEIYILSNNHVLAASNTGKLGDAILQPGAYDGGMDDDKIATLAKFIPIDFGNDPDDPVPPPSECSGSNLMKAVMNRFSGAMSRGTRAVMIQAAGNKVDAALAKPMDDSLVDPNILGVGAPPAGIGDGVLGMPIQKSGRTTEHTTGTITQVNVAVNVSYGDAGTALFTDQLMAGAMSDGGDSGSAVLDMDRRVVGLLFAGSDSTTVINRIGNVIAALGIEGVVI